MAKGPINQHKAMAMGEKPAGGGGKPSTPQSYGKGGKAPGKKK